MIEYQLFVVIWLKQDTIYKMQGCHKGREQQIFPSFYEHDTWLLSQKRKKKDKKEL